MPPSHNLGPSVPQDKPNIFPSPLIIPPLQTHKQSLIILHGRGSCSSKFAPSLLSTPSPKYDNQTLQTLLPQAKFIFPTASRTRAIAYNRAYTHQWFDCFDIKNPRVKEEIMWEGLGKSVEFIHRLLEAEVKKVGGENVVIWGLSQGCAAVLAAVLAWDGERIGGVVGMCGWLPFGGLLNDIMRDEGMDFEGADEDPFEGFENEDDLFEWDSEDGGKRKKDLAMQAVKVFREDLEMQRKKGMAFRSSPVFLGHGIEDDRVLVKLGREAKRCLQALGADVEMVEYEGLGHWYSKEMLDDIFRFLKENLGKSKIEEKV